MGLQREYKGFVVAGHALPIQGCGRWAGAVALRHYTAAGVNESKLDLPGDGFASEECAEAAAMAHGFDAIDGRVRGFEPSRLL